MIFDAWAHEGDPLRRTFLDKAIDDLETAKWLSEKAALEFRGQLSGRTSKIHTHTTARLSTEGKLAAGSAFLIPLGIALLNNNFHSHHRAVQYVGLLLALGPLLVALIYLLLKGLGLAVGGKNAATGWRRDLARLEPFNFFANVQETDTTTEGIEHADPTSVEFERMFSRLLTSAVTDSRRLLIVLDNLDRVQEGDAKTVLATMQTFTSSSNHAGTAWADGVWTLIPYDPAGLDRLWNPDAAKDEEATEGTGLTAPLRVPTAAAFVEKVFQIRFEAPPLVLSDWRAYLSSLLRDALPSADEAEVLAVLQLRALYPGAEPDGLVAQDAPTPRQLKQFVNQIGAVRRLRADAPLVCVAYFVLLRRDRLDIPGRLLAGRLPHRRLAPLLPVEIEIDLAALHYGTTPELAQQILLGTNLDRALASEDETLVRQLAERPGFVDALDSLDMVARANDGAIELTRTVDLLERAGVLENPAADAWVCRILRRLVPEVESWALTGSGSGSGLAVILHSFCDDDEALVSALSRIEMAPRGADAEGQLQLEGAAALADGLIQRGLDPDVMRIQLEIPADRLASSLSTYGALTEEPRSDQVLEVTFDPQQVADCLAQAAVTDQPQVLRKALEVLLQRPARVDLTELANRCVTVLREQEVAGPEQLDALLAAADTARIGSDPETILGAAADDGTLMHVVSVGNRNSWRPAEAAASLLQLVVRPAFPDPVGAREASTGTQVLRQALTNPEVDEPLVSAQLDWLIAHRGEATSLLFSINETEAYRPWVERQLKALFNGEALSLSPEQFVQHWDFLRQALGGEAFARLTQELVVGDEALQAVTAAGNEPGLADAVVAASQNNKKLLDWARGIVRDASDDDWRAALANPDGGQLLDLALRLRNLPRPPSPASGFRDAVRAHFQQLADGATVWAPDGSTFAELLGMLPASSRRVLASQLCADLEGLTTVLDPQALDTFGQFLASEKSFRTHQKLPNWIERCVAIDDWPAVQWVVDVARVEPDTLSSKDRADEITTLKTRVVEKIDANPEGVAESLRALAELLDLQI